MGNITIDFNDINKYITKSIDPNEPIEKYGIHNIAQRIRLYFGDDCGLEYAPISDLGITARIKIKVVKESERNSNLKQDGDFR